MTGTMGERLAWARNQQGLILQQVSDRSGLAIGYISQLEKGAKLNPTIDALYRLAKALGVSVAFLLGEVQAPPYDDEAGATLVGGQAWIIGQRFARHVAALTRVEKENLQLLTVEARFAKVVDFLCEQFATTFTRPVIAFQLGLSVRSLNDILERDCEVGPMVLSQMVMITGIPTQFFTHGLMEAPADSTKLSPAQVIQYMEPLTVAAEFHVTPEQLVTLIRNFADGR